MRTQSPSPTLFWPSSTLSTRSCFTSSLNFQFLIETRPHHKQENFGSYSHFHEATLHVKSIYLTWTLHGKRIPRSHNLTKQLIPGKCLVQISFSFLRRTRGIFTMGTHSVNDRASRAWKTHLYTVFCSTSVIQRGLSRCLFSVFLKRLMRWYSTLVFQRKHYPG